MSCLDGKSLLLLRRSCADARLFQRRMPPKPFPVGPSPTPFWFSPFHSRAPPAVRWWAGLGRGAPPIQLLKSVKSGRVCNSQPLRSPEAVLPWTPPIDSAGLPRRPMAELEDTEGSEQGAPSSKGSNKNEEEVERSAALRGRGSERSLRRGNGGRWGRERSGGFQRQFSRSSASAAAFLHISSGNASAHNRHSRRTAEGRTFLRHDRRYLGLKDMQLTFMTRPFVNHRTK